MGVWDQDEKGKAAFYTVGGSEGIRKTAMVGEGDLAKRTAAGVATGEHCG